MDTLKTIRKKAEKLMSSGSSPKRLSPRSSEDSSRQESTDMSISGPTNVVHNHHARVDEHGNLDGLPNDMKMMLKVRII